MCIHLYHCTMLFTKWYCSASPAIDTRIRPNTLVVLAVVHFSFFITFITNINPTSEWCHQWQKTTASERRLLGPLDAQRAQSLPPCVHVAYAPASSVKKHIQISESYILQERYLVVSILRERERGPGVCIVLYTTIRTTTESVCL